MATTREFIIKDLEESEFPFEAPTGWTIVSDKLTGKSRWSDIHTIIFRTPEQPTTEAWRTTYQKGSTEMQDSEPLWYGETFTATLVREVEKTVKVWEAAP